MVFSICNCKIMVLGFHHYARSLEYNFIFSSNGELACITKNDKENEDEDVLHNENLANEFFENCNWIREQVNSENPNWKKIVGRLCRICKDDTCKINVYSNENCYMNIISAAKSIYDVEDKKIVVEYRMSPVVIDRKVMILLENKEKEAFKLFKDRTIYNENSESDNKKFFQNLFYDISKVYGVKVEIYHLVINSVSYVENHPNEDLYQLKLNCFKAFVSLCAGVHTGEVFGTDFTTMFLRYTQYLDIIVNR